jgi:hypothetical protein
MIDDRLFGVLVCRTTGGNQAGVCLFVENLKGVQDLWDGHDLTKD